VQRCGFLQVYALDLLGFGASDKALIDYSIELWAELVKDFSDEMMDSPVTLVGNSIGSLVILDAVNQMKAKHSRTSVRGVVLINCAGKENDHVGLLKRRAHGMHDADTCSACRLLDHCELQVE
jgi:pimeloyl-ACP methyl ester carboxylesterase